MTDAQQIGAVKTTNQHGKRIEIQLWEDDRNNKTIQRILKGGRVNKDIHFSDELFNKFFALAAKRQRQNVEAGEMAGMIDPTEMDTRTRQQLLQDVVGSMDEQELKQAKERGVIDDRTVERLEAVFTKPRYQTRDDVEKTKEHVLQMIYEEFGLDYFYPSEFNTQYNARWQKATPHMYLKNLHEQSLVNREKIPKGEDRPGRARYKYKLSKKAIEDLKQYGEFTSLENKNFRQKQDMLPEHRRKKQ